MKMGIMFLLFDRNASAAFQNGNTSHQQNTGLVSQTEAKLYLIHWSFSVLASTTHWHKDLPRFDNPFVFIWEKKKML